MIDETMEMNLCRILDTPHAEMSEIYHNSAIFANLHRVRMMSYAISAACALGARRYVPPYLGVLRDRS
ncbi:hypothetical protein [Aestuariivita boseongensis]|uniref:hypothetical protein n=1 Tax=Aestuariivita boseongensis TaxID=1470562 RepID=UPI000682A689|nr:hypothetical protein [Aestuariivita boseongensis]